MKKQQNVYIVECKNWYECGVVWDARRHDCQSRQLNLVCSCPKAHITALTDGEDPFNHTLSSTAKDRVFAIQISLPGNR